MRGHKSQDSRQPGGVIDGVNYQLALILSFWLSSTRVNEAEHEKRGLTAYFVDLELSTFSIFLKEVILLFRSTSSLPLFFLAKPPLKNVYHRICQEPVQ